MTEAGFTDHQALYGAVTERRNPPMEPAGELRIGAAQLYAAFYSLTGAGFTDHQALYLVGVLLDNGKRPGGDGGKGK